MSKLNFTPLHFPPMPVLPQPEQCPAFTAANSPIVGMNWPEVFDRAVTCAKLLIAAKADIEAQVRAMARLA